MWLKKLFTVPEGQKVTEKMFSRILVSSVCSMLLCMACLAGTTWAWFTAEIENSGNVIEIAAVTVETEIFAQAAPAAVSEESAQAAAAAVNEEDAQGEPAAVNENGDPEAPAAADGDGDPVEPNMNSAQSELAASTTGGTVQETPVAKNENGVYELAAGTYRIRVSVANNAAKADGSGATHPVYVLMTAKKVSDNSTVYYSLDFPMGSGMAEATLPVTEPVEVSFSVSWVQPDPDNAPVIGVAAPMFSTPPAEDTSEGSGGEDESADGTTESSDENNGSADGEANNPAQDGTNGSGEGSENPPAEDTKDSASTEGTGDNTSTGDTEGNTTEGAATGSTGELSGETGEGDRKETGDGTPADPVQTPPEGDAGTAGQTPPENNTEQTQDPPAGA